MMDSTKEKLEKIMAFTEYNILIDPREVIQQLHLKPCTAYNLINKAGLITMPRRQINIVKALLEHKTHREAAASLGISRQSVTEVNYINFIIVRLLRRHVNNNSTKWIWTSTKKSKKI